MSESQWPLECLYCSSELKGFVITTPGEAECLPCHHRFDLKQWVHDWRFAQIMNQAFPDEPAPLRAEQLWVPSS